MAEEHRPAWQRDVLWKPQWTRLELINALLGRDLDDGERDAAQRFSEGDPFVLWPLPLDRAQARALSHIEASHAAGELTTLIYRNTNGDFDIARDEAIRWAVARRELFLDFPFSIDDVPAAARSAVGARADLDKPLEQRERKTLYSIIDALAHKAGIDVSIPSRAGLERPQIKQRPVQRLNSRPRCMATLLGAAR